MQKDIKGEKFGRLTAVRFIGRKGSNYLWEYECECGKKVTAQKQGVTHGNTKSCGCLQREVAADMKKKHGMYGTNFYRVYRAMRDRCENKNCKGYKKWYGIRGIRCLWGTFEEFKKDMYEGYSEHRRKNKNTTIDRIDNNGHYCKSNCRWVTQKENNLNKRR